MTRNDDSASGRVKRRMTGGGPGFRVARNTFSAPPNRGTRRLATPRTSRRRPVVVLESHHLGRRETQGHLEQVAGGRSREPVDRLVVVAHDAQVVTAAEPFPQERLLQKVDVLVLIYRERAVAPQ